MTQSWYSTTSSSSYGALGPGQTLVSIMQDTKFQALIRILEMLIPAEVSIPIRIEHGLISQPIRTQDFFVNIDCSSLFPSGIEEADHLQTATPPSMIFRCDKKTLKRLKAMRHTGDIEIIEDRVKKVYLVLSGHMPVQIPFVQSFNDLAPTNLLTMSIGSPVYNVPIKKIRSYLGKKSPKRFLLFDDQLEQAQVYNEGPFSFVPTNILRLSGQEPDEKLGFRYFPAVTGDNKVNITLAYHQGTYWLITQSELIKTIKATTFERLWVS